MYGTKPEISLLSYENVVRGSSFSGRRKGATYGKQFGKMADPLRQAAVEKDPERLMGLIREISQLLDERQEQIEKKQVMQEVSAQHRSLA